MCVNSESYFIFQRFEKTGRSKCVSKYFKQTRSQSGRRPAVRVGRRAETTQAGTTIRGIHCILLPLFIKNQDDLCFLITICSITSCVFLQTKQEDVLWVTEKDLLFHFPFTVFRQKQNHLRLAYTFLWIFRIFPLTIWAAAVEYTHQNLFCAA